MSDTDFDLSPKESFCKRLYGEITSFRCICRSGRPIALNDMRVIVHRDDPIDTPRGIWLRAVLICPYCKMIFNSGLVEESDAEALEDSEN